MTTVSSPLSVPAAFSYVIQYVLDLSDAQATATIITNMLGHIGALSVQKFSSNVIEKCLTADTLVNTGDGLSRPIQHLEQGDTVLCRRGQGLGMGGISRAWRSGRREVVRVELEDGRCLRCTADHRVRTTEGWRKVEEMKVDDTRLIVGVEGVEDRGDDLEAAFTIDLPHLSLSMKEQRRRCLALMRLAGFRCGQSMTSSEGDGDEVVVQHIHDRLCATQDVELISDDECHFRQTQDGSWAVALPSCLTSGDCLLCLRLLQRKDCPASLRREFLAACFGACGQVHPGRMTATFHSSPTQPLAIAQLAALRSLLSSFLDGDGPVFQGADASTPTLSIVLPSLLSFADCIGSRYHVAQSCLLSAVSSYHGFSQRWPSSPVPFSEYCERIGCSDWFRPSTSSFTSSSIPTFHLRFVSLTPNDLTDVFDLTVSSSSSPSFLAHGVLVHNCLELANDKLRSRMIDELVNPERLPRLLQDPYANYVLQKALSVSKKQQLDRLVQMIRPHLPQLKNTAFGKRIQNKILKRFPEIDLDAQPQMEFYGAAGGSLEGVGGAALHGQMQSAGGGGAVSAVSTLGGGVYEGGGAAGGGGYPGSASPPPLLSPSSRQLGAAIGPVAAAYPHHPSAYSEAQLNADLGLNALNQSLSSLSVSSGQQQGTGSGGDGGGGPFYSGYPSESNGSLGVGAVGGGAPHPSPSSSLFLP